MWNHASAKVKKKSKKKKNKVNIMEKNRKKSWIRSLGVFNLGHLVSL